MISGDSADEGGKGERVEGPYTRRLRLVANALGATWRLPLFMAIIFGILVVAAFMLLRFTFPTTINTFISRLQFTFPGAEAGRYPNELPFTINEILDRVYNDLELNRYGIRHEDFYSAFSIRPFSLTENEIADSFRQLLADRRILFAERERIERQLKDRLEQASRGAAELSFTLRGGSVFPSEVGRAVVQRVPRIWAQLAIEKKGVLRIQGFSSEEKVIPEEKVKDQPLPFLILTLMEASQRIDDRLLEMARAPGIKTLRDDASGKSFRDLESDIRELQLFRINPLRAALTTYAFPNYGRELRDILQQRIVNLKILEDNTLRQAQAVGDSLARYVDATSALARGASERRGTEPNTAGGTTIPQVSESFIDKVIELTRASVYAAQYQIFVTDRTLTQFELNRRASEHRGERRRWDELLASLPSEGASEKEPDQTTLVRLTQQMHSAVNEINAKWAALSRLEAEFAANRLSRTAEIYAPLVSGPDIIRLDPVFNLSALSAALSLVLMFCGMLWVGLALLYIRRESN
jgi:hypothetical protein